MQRRGLCPKLLMNRCVRQHVVVSYVRQPVNLPVWALIRPISIPLQNRPGSAREPFTCTLRINVNCSWQCYVTLRKHIYPPFVLLWQLMDHYSNDWSDCF